MVEVVIVVVLVGVLTGLVVQSLADLAHTQAYSRGQVRVCEIGDRVARSISQDIAVAAKVYTDGAQADAVLAVMDVPAAWRPADARLPALTSRGYFEADPDTDLETGNLLLLACHHEPVMVNTGPGGVGGQDLRIDLVRFVLYTPRTDLPTVDLARWGSGDAAILSDIDAIVDGDARRQALQQLHDLGVRYAWDAAEQAGTGLHDIAPDKRGDARIRPFGASSRLYAQDDQIQASILGARHVELVANGKAGGLVVPVYAAPLSTGFPAGLEIKVDGPSTGKLVLVRLVLRTSLGRHRNAAELIRIVNSRGG